MPIKSEKFWRHRNISYVCSNSWFLSRYECYCCHDENDLVCDHLEYIQGITNSIVNNRYMQTPDYNATLFAKELQFIPENFIPLCRNCHSFVSFLTNGSRPFEYSGKFTGVKNVIHNILHEILDNPYLEEHTKSWELEVLQRQLEVSYWHFDRIRNPLRKTVKDKRGNIMFIANNTPNKNGNDFINNVKKLLNEVAQMTEIDVEPPIYDNRKNPFIN